VWCVTSQVPGCLGGSNLGLDMAMPDLSSLGTEGRRDFDDIQKRHTPFKTILDPQYDGATSTVLQHYARAGDSAIWTGHYLAAKLSATR
jgi:hypothetical protein